MRRLGELLGTQEQQNDPTHALLSSNLFGFVETATFRFWQPLDRERLRDLALSRSNVAVMSEPERERVLRKVDELYDELRPRRRRHAAALRHALLQGRGPRPRRSRRTTCRAAGPPTRIRDDGGDADALLIDFQ